MSEAKTIPLKHPITIGERTVTELNFPADPEFGLLGALDKADGNMERMFHLIAASTGEHVMFIRKLKAADIQPVMEAAQTLMGELLPQSLSQPTSDM